MKLALILTFCISLCNPIFGQSKKTSDFRSYSLCDIDLANGNEINTVNCQKQNGTTIFEKIEIIPNESITLYFKDDDRNISKSWDSNDFLLNNTNDLFIYKLIKTDLRENGALSIHVIMRLDYSVQSLVCIRNTNGELREIKLFDK
ncbi:hypothetical protein [Gillisia sp. JM1]|uniref:hypothetical protein n=1 Tax=Gillisia sp. JM1 TaxID=1283286 RepID=UPI00047CCADE|nr:hypothetical protein [Gillisia sp. JM1]